MTDEEFFMEYLIKNNLNEDDLTYKTMKFDSDKSDDEIFELVSNGLKKARLTPLQIYKDRNLIPKEGDLYLIKDTCGDNKLIIETTKIRILLFKNIQFDLAKIEGEDKNLMSWQKNHIEYFTRDSKENDYKFDYDMSVIFEEFEVIYKRA